MIIAHTLSFPGAFSETGLFPGGVQTTSWLYPAWHTVLPITIIVSTMLPSNQTARRRLARACYPIAASILLCVGGAAAITFLIIAARDRLPALVEGSRLLPAAHIVIGALLLLPLAALIALARRRPRSILDLWLILTMLTWLYTISLVTLISAPTIRYRMVCRSRVRPSDLDIYPAPVAVRNRYLVRTLCGRHHRRAT